MSLKKLLKPKKAQKCATCTLTFDRLTQLFLFTMKSNLIKRDFYNTASTTGIASREN